MRSRFTNYFFFFSLTVLFFIIERGEMFRRFGDEKATFEMLNYVILAMITLSGLYILSNKKYLLKTTLQKRFVTTMVYIYILTVIWSLFHPLSTRNVYIYFLLPVFMFLYMSVVTRLVDKINVVLYSLYIIGILLVVYYFLNYTNNIFYNVERQSNTSYTVLYFLPIMLCVNNKWLRYIAIMLVSLVVMFSLKRGGFIAVLLAIAVYFYIDQIKLKGKQMKLWGWLLFLGLGVAAYFAVIRVNNVLLNNLLFDRMSMIDETGGSGREYIYKDVFSLIGSGHILNFIFGHGWCATARDTLTHLTAHNDFLEVLYDFGIVAFVLYIMFVVELFKVAKRMIREKSIYAPAIGTSLVIFLTNSMVSHIWIYCRFLLIFAVFWGIINATYKYNR